MKTDSAHNTPKASKTTIQWKVFRWVKGHIIDLATDHQIQFKFQSKLI